MYMCVCLLSRPFDSPLALVRSLPSFPFLSIARSSFLPFSHTQSLLIIDQHRQTHLSILPFTYSHIDLSNSRTLSLSKFKFCAPIDIAKQQRAQEEREIYIDSSVERPLRYTTVPIIGKVIIDTYSTIPTIFGISASLPLPPSSKYISLSSCSSLTSSSPYSYPLSFSFSSSYIIILTVSQHLLQPPLSPPLFLFLAFHQQSCRVPSASQLRRHPI